MIICGTHDELAYFVMQCQKTKDCKLCMLRVFCDADRLSFKRFNPQRLKAFETGKFEPMIIMKGDNVDEDTKQ